MTGPDAIEQRPLLTIQPALGVRRTPADDAQSRPVLGNNRDHPEMRADAGHVRHGDEGDVLRAYAATATISLRIHASGRTEEDQCLIHEAGTEIDDRSASLRWVTALAPSAGRVGAPDCPFSRRNPLTASRTAAAVHRRTICTPRHRWTFRFTSRVRLCLP
jgi:hypothetical protein